MTWFVLCYLILAWELAAYWWIHRGGKPFWFDLAVVVGMPPFIVTTLKTGAYPSFFVTLAWGMIGLWGLWRDAQHSTSSSQAAKRT